jgi:hypothetical protein
MLSLSYLFRISSLLLLERNSNNSAKLPLATLRDFEKLCPEKNSERPFEEFSFLGRKNV